VLILPSKLWYRAKKDGGWAAEKLGIVEALKEDVDRPQILARPPDIGMRTTKKEEFRKQALELRLLQVAQN
jgi:hypothetical protein